MVSKTPAKGDGVFPSTQTSPAQGAWELSVDGSSKMEGDSYMTHLCSLFPDALNEDELRK